LKDLKLLAPQITSNKLENKVFQEDANSLNERIKGDILYLDPPYNQRQYAANFHLLESIAVWDKQELYGKTGLREYTDKKSEYCQKRHAYSAFADLIEKAQADYIVLSYNNEGIIPRDKILDLLRQRGSVKEHTRDYRRFRTERDHEKRKYKQCDDRVLEHLYILKTKGTQ